MNKSTLPVLGLALIAAIGITACDGLGKMVKKAKDIKYEVTPNPLEMHNDSVVVKMTAKYPEKMFAKKAKVVITPNLKYNGTERALKQEVLVGEKSEEKGKKVAYEKGGSVSYQDVVPYTPEMKVATLELKAQGSIKTKVKEFPPLKVADGIIVTPLLIKNDEKPTFAKDAFTKTVPVTAAAQIFFTVNQSSVRPSELSSAEMKTLKEFIKTGAGKGYTFKGVTVSAYASPDGEQALNSNLAEDRAKATVDALIGEFKKAKVEAGKDKSFYNTAVTAEDWDGFKKAMEASTMKDKDLVLRVLTMYNDLDQREKEIKNMAATYTEISGDIMPKLRRSTFTINAEVNSRSDEQIVALAASHPDSLGIEELLYFANTLTQDLNQKLAAFQTAEKNFPQDWRGVNNVGYIYILQNKANDAAAQFEKADKLSPNNPIIQNNLGIIARWKGDRAKAFDLYTKARTAGSEPSYNMGIINIQKGKYDDALSNFGSAKTFNVALAQVLAGKFEDANKTIDESPDKASAMGFYLKAIVGARQGKADAVVANLKAAIAKDASLKEKAAEDAEFIKVRDNAEVKAVLQ